eukprot:gene545-586_t
MLAWRELGVLKQFRSVGKVVSKLTERFSCPIVPEDGLISVELPNREGLTATPSKAAVTSLNIGRRWAAALCDRAPEEVPGSVEILGGAGGGAAGHPWTTGTLVSSEALASRARTDSGLSQVWVLTSVFDAQRPQGESRGAKMLRRLGSGGGLSLPGSGAGGTPEYPNTAPRSPGLKTIGGSITSGIRELSGRERKKGRRQGGWSLGIRLVQDPENEGAPGNDEGLWK